MDLAAAEGIPLKVEPIPRELLYVADELFFAYVIRIAIDILFN